MPLSTSEIENLAEQAFRSGRWKRAANALSQLISIQPTASHWLRLGACQHRLGDLKSALFAFEQAILIDSTQHQAHLAAATVSSALCLHETALQHCLAALELAPADPLTLTNAGIAFEALGKKDEALSHYEQALRYDPCWPDALANRGKLLLDAGRIREALANNRFFAQKHPQSMIAQFNLGETCMVGQSFEEAAAAYRQARILMPGHGRALLQEAYARCRLKQFALAQDLLNQAWQNFPDLVQTDRQRIFPNIPPINAPLDAQVLFLNAIYESLEQCDWRQHAHFLQRFAEIVAGDQCPSEIPLGFQGVATGLPAELQKKLACRIASGVIESPPLALWRNSSDRSPRPLRIAYLSQDFRNHATGLLAHKLFALHHRQDFNILAYAVGPKTDDPLRREIAATVDQFSYLSTLDDDTAAQRIAADGIDILIDLAGYSDHARPGILARRPAPIQVAWLAYPATTGAPWMDYIVLDPGTAPPEMDQHCSEAIIRLPHTYFFCSYANESVSAVSRQEAGLPERGRILAAFHNGFKIDPTVFSIWMRLMQNHPDAVLWLLAGMPEMENNLKNEAALRGIDSDRLIFAPRIAHQQHLARFALADFLLDTPQCNGGTTICDALVAGVPVLTCTGAAISQRVATGLLQAGGFVKGITSSLEEYEACAHKWLNTPDLLTSLREELRQARPVSVFFQLDDWVSSFESALRAVWQRHQMGLPPQAFSIQPRAAFSSSVPMI